MGTGWLVRPDLLITAGHVVYDWSSRLGPTKEIKCYIGYNGRASVGTSHVQARFAKKVVTTVEWLESTDNRQKDVAFVQVDPPFLGNLRIFGLADTQESDTQVLLGVVGYPGDKSLVDEVSGDNEAGAQMYEEFAPTSYDLKTSRRNMLEYKISTFGGKHSPPSSKYFIDLTRGLGQCGAPLLRKNSRLTVIGTHCYGGGGPGSSNSGNAIGGLYGTNYNAYIDTFSTGDKPVIERRKDGISIISTEARATSGGNNSVISSFQSNEVEGFWDVLGLVAKIGSAALPIASSLLGGPLGGAIGTAAGAILSSVAGAEIIATSSNKPEGQVNGESLAHGAAERAVLAEAALQTILSLEPSSELEQILDHMKSNWESNAPNVNATASHFQPQLMECALDVMVKKWDNLAAHGKNPTEATLVLERRSLSGIDKTEASTGRNKQGGDFVEGLLAPSLPVDGEEEMFDALGPFLRKAVSYGTPIVSKAAKAALNEYGSKLINKLADSDQNTNPESLTTTNGAHDHAARVVFKRALMADAALQALMSRPCADLKILKPKDSSLDSNQQEGIFDLIKTAVQKIAPSVLDTANSAAKKLFPAGFNAVTQKASSTLSPLAKTQTAEKKPLSLMERFRESGGSNKSIKVGTLSGPSNELEAELQAREHTWVPLKERRASLDDNDDGFVPMEGSPP